MLSAEARHVIFDVWLVFMVVWFTAALTTKPREKSVKGHLRLPFGLIALAAILLFDQRINHSWLALPLLPNPAWLVLPGFALTLAGMALAFWARIYLGRNWGPPATMRVGHELVTSGPYAFIRHPIYWGMGAAILGTALAIGNVLVFLVAIVAILRFWWAARAENALLVRQFGEQAERR